MSRKTIEAQLRARMTPRPPSRKGHEAEVQFAEQRLQRAVAKCAVADAEHDEAVRYLEVKKAAEAAFIAANPDPQIEIF
ncbi:hypothetical protein [Novosphingobium sp. AP12]|uniref:hypothetical protein n=1 Tax=Novosphingobium sp. AP12 TaxID=1144305 RepID=UPI000271DE0E|nr:hypothetical protein [Novosphingobium sp. AP12]EJL21912.1 hypothetical protein PMI02_04897 [Novosphingobium sp. AP12]